MKHHVIGGKVPILLAVCETKTLTHATFTHGYSISSLVLTSRMLYIISFIIFPVHHQVWQVAVSLQYLAAGMERTSQANEQEESRATGKDTRKKRTL